MQARLATFLPVCTRSASGPGSRRRRWPPGPAVRGLVAVGSCQTARPGRARGPHGPQPWLPGGHDTAASAGLRWAPGGLGWAALHVGKAPGPAPRWGVSRGGPWPGTGSWGGTPEGCRLQEPRRKRGREDQDLPGSRFAGGAGGKELQEGGRSNLSDANDNSYIT